MSKNCIYLKTDSESFKENLAKILYYYPVNNPEINRHPAKQSFASDVGTKKVGTMPSMCSANGDNRYFCRESFEAIAEMQLEKNNFGSNIFIGDIREDGANVTFVAPKRVGIYSALPYLNYLIMQKSPGTDLLGKTNFDLPNWFFRSTCTDIALSSYARNYYFTIRLKNRDLGGEMELWYEMVQIKSDFKEIIKMLFYYSAFPVALLTLLTDFAILPVLNTMMPVEIKAIYIFAFNVFFPVPLRYRFDVNWGLFINAAIIALSYFITKIPEQYLLPETSLVLMILGLFFVLFFGMNFYTISRMPLVIEGIFLKTVKGLI